MARPKKEESTATAVLNEIASSINKMSERLDALEKPLVAAAVVAPVEIPKTFESKYPIPLEYQMIVENTLNRKFRIDIDYLADSAAFNFAILVPEEYSNAGKPHWETYHEDRRSRVIINALGSNGVRDWATQVYNNFNPETQARITHDRSLPV